MVSESRQDLVELFKYALNISGEGARRTGKMNVSAETAFVGCMLFMECIETILALPLQLFNNASISLWANCANGL